MICATHAQIVHRIIILQHSLRIVLYFTMNLHLSIVHFNDYLSNYISVYLH